VPETSVNQAYIFACSVVGGIIAALLYDLFRIKRKTIKTGIIATYIEDFIYWVLVSIIMFLLLYFSNDGEIRGFIFLGALLGVVLYVLLLSRIVTGLILFIIKIIKKVIKLIIKILSILIFTPLKFILNIILKPFKFIFKKLKRLIKHLAQKRKTSVARQNIFKKIYRNVRKKF